MYNGDDILYVELVTHFVIYCYNLLPGAMIDLSSERHVVSVQKLNI